MSVQGKIVSLRQAKSAVAVKRAREVLDSVPVEIIDLRHFGAAELRPLLMEEARLWSERMSWDYQGSAEMILRYLDSKILPGYAAVDNGNVVVVYCDPNHVILCISTGQTEASDVLG